MEATSFCRPRDSFYGKSCANLGGAVEGTANPAISMVCHTARSYSRRFPDDQLWRVVDTFCATKANGTGFGFTIARAVVKTYGGKIWTANRPESGAVVNFVLSLVRPS